MTKVVAIKFKNGSKLYYFSPKEGDVYERNMPVIVETSRGMEYAFVAYPTKEVTDDEIVLPLKPIVRIATQKDTESFLQSEQKKPFALQVCKEKIELHSLDMKLIDCEISFDGSKRESFPLLPVTFGKLRCRSTYFQKTAPQKNQ